MNSMHGVIGADHRTIDKASQFSNRRIAVKKMVLGEPSHRCLSLMCRPKDNTPICTVFYGPNLQRTQRTVFLVQRKPLWNEEATIGEKRQVKNDN
jgi:hypothetical protein